MQIEQVIFNNLVNDEQYVRKTIPYLKADYFRDHGDRVVFDLISGYINKYNASPTKQALAIDLGNVTKISEETYKRAQSIISEIPDHKLEAQDLDWLVDRTEEFCQNRAIYNAVHQTIQIIDGQDKANAPGSIPLLLQDALAVSFDNSVGHDFIEDIEERFKFYHRKEERIPFDLDLFNTITRGGLPKKTLSICLAGTGVGKSLFMCHCAAAALSHGLNVLYITLEMAEEKIAERIDANLLDVPIEELYDLPADSYARKHRELRKRSPGRLIIKEYPTTGANAGNFRHLLNELRIKKNFKPDIIFVDYLNICSSSRLRQSANVNSYTYVKAIAEELRGLAVEFNVPIFSATQTTRGGYDNSDISLTDTSESFGLPATADFMFALIQTDELKAINQMLVKQLKNRFSDPERLKRFVIGVDKSKMRLYNLEISAQHDIVQDSPVYDSNSQFDKSKFRDFK